MTSQLRGRLLTVKSEKKKMVESAAIRVTKSANTQVTEVITSERHLILEDRVVAAVAALLLCGATYFVIWGLLSVILDSGSGLGLVLVRWTWRLPLYAAVLTTIAAFVSPGWTYSIFGKVIARLAELIDEAVAPRK
jgi:hypothetical protein